MKTIDVEKIIKTKKLDKKELAQQLFPGNKYASLALNRVIKGDGFLDSNQISLLSELTGIAIGNLYSGNEWDLKNNKGLAVLTSGNFRAELDTKTWVTKVFDNDSLLHESVIHSGTTSLSAYLTQLSEIVGQQIENK
jgi:hypothetical protein